MCMHLLVTTECHHHSEWTIVAELLLKERGHCGVTGITSVLHGRPKNIPCQRSREKPSAIQASQ